jgi:hypothetical protein
MSIQVKHEPAGLPGAIESDPRWLLVCRIVESERFARSARIRDFLLYVSRAALEDRLEDISEHKIGERIFERSQNYNASEDNIVRSHARILRQKLEAYFSDEGANEPVILQIPKGGYAPSFEPRHSAAPPEPVVAPEEPRATPRRVANAWIFAVAILSLTIVFLAWSLVRARSAGSHAAAGPSPGVKALWSQLLSDRAVTTIVAPDSTYYLIQEASGQQLDLNSYLKQSVPQDSKGLEQLKTLFPRLPFMRYTTFDALSTTIRVLSLAEKFPGKVQVRYARDVTLRDLSPGNVVFIGRTMSNSWVRLFESQMNFRSEADFERKREIWRNVKPQPGEESEYVPKRDGNQYEAYGSIAFLPNLSGGNVLIIAGSNSASQEGCAHFITDEGQLEKLVRKIGHEGQPLPYFNALLRITTVNEVPQDPSVIAYRVLGR